MSVVNISVNHYIVSLSEACGVLWLPVLQTIKTPETLHSQTMEMAVEYLFRSTFSKNIFCLPCFTRHILFPETILASSCCSPQVLSTLAACRMSHSQSWRSVQGYWNAGGGENCRILRSAFWVQENKHRRWSEIICGDPQIMYSCFIPNNEGMLMCWVILMSRFWRPSVILLAFRSHSCLPFSGITGFNRWLMPNYPS